VIFADMKYPETYEQFHEELGGFLAAHFPRLQSGLQGESWFWILEDEEKVAIDTFHSMKHQVKAERPGPLVQKVLDVLRARYEVDVYDHPVREPHED
jgi:hypothetical protein